MVNHKKVTVLGPTPIWKLFTLIKLMHQFKKGNKTLNVLLSDCKQNSYYLLSCLPDIQNCFTYFIDLYVTLYQVI